MRRIILAIAVLATLVQPLPARADAPWQPTVFVSLTPCVLFDTRNAIDGIVQAGTSRPFNIVGSLANFTNQGGTNGGCGIPGFYDAPVVPQARAVLINLVAVDPTGGGNLKAWASDQAEPTGGIVNYQLLNPPMNNSNAVAIQVRRDAPGNDITVKANGAAVHVRGVALGYYSPIGLDNAAASVAETVAGGIGNTASGLLSSVGGGSANGASGTESSVAGGGTNHATGDGSTVAGGFVNTASGEYATVPGGKEALAAHYGQLAYASGGFAGAGDAQTSTYVARATTTDSGVHQLFLDGSDANQRMTIPGNTAWTFEAHIAGIDNSTNHLTGGYIVRGVIANKDGTIDFVGTPTTITLGEDDPTWDATAGHGNTNPSLQIHVQGNGQTIRWVATITTTEVTF